MGDHSQVMEYTWGDHSRIKENIWVTTIGLIRHGMTDWNREGRAQGQRDVPLNEEGLRQAERLGLRLSAERWDAIYSSDLSRAAETARIIAKAMGKSVTGCDPRLREISNGNLDGTTIAERVERWGENWRELEHGKESAESGVSRSMEFLQEAMERFPDGKVLVVSHGALIARLMAHLLKGQEIADLHNTCLSILEQTDTGWNCSLMACTKHLEKV
jgi:probable phosphoglycerate mutase